MLVALLIGGWGASNNQPPQRTGDAARQTGVEQAAPQVDAPGSITTMQERELPPEALETLELIFKGGPFPYRQDGTVFQNRERRLPIQPQGYYREYTVRTPGENDRGARRIVMGREGEIYYTDDHYDSFRRVLR